MAAPARRPARRGTGRARARIEPEPGGEKPLLPPRLIPATSPAQREKAAPPRTPGQSKPGQLRDFALPLRRRGSKARGEAESQLSTATNPIGVFPFHPICESAVRGSRRRRHRCAGPREDAATPARRRRARGGARRRRAAPEEEEAVNQEREHGPEPRRTFAGVNTYTTGDIYTAGNAFTAQNTDATPPTGRPRLHRRPTVSTAATLLSSPPWTPSCDGFPSDETRRC
jgi:hypothetical protein